MVLFSFYWLCLIFLSSDLLHIIQSQEESPSTIVEDGVQLFITAPADDPLLLWTSMCGKQDEGWFQVIESLLPTTRANIYDVSAGYGHSFIRLALKVGPTGSAIGIDRNTTKLAMLQENVGRFDLWSRSLIVQNYNATDPIGQYHEKNFFEELFGLLSWQCPHLIHFRENGEDFQNLVETFDDLKFLLTSCAPLLYFDFMRIDMFITFTEKLLSMQESGHPSYEIYMFPLCCKDPNTSDTMVRYGLFAMLKALQTQNHNRIIELHGGIVITSLKGLRKLISHACDYSLTSFDEGQAEDVDDSQQQLLHRGRYIGRVEIDFDMIYYPFGIIKCLHKYHRQMKERYVEDDFFYRVDLFHTAPDNNDAEMTSEGQEKSSADENSEHTLVMQINRECFSWVHSIVDRLTKELDYGANSICLTPNVTSEHIGPERLAALSNCFQFANERLSLLKTVFDRREESVQKPIVYHRSVSTVDGNASSTVEDFIVAKSNEIEYSHYPYGRQYHMKQWFKRNPFESIYEPDICTEPIFCSYGETFQNALRRWQYPPLYRKDVFVETASVQAKIHLPNPSCEDAKFFVYEPPSNLHGIGSMLLLVAAAMRTAFCLDRIFILATHEQQGTILKWEPKGCNVNIFECYFEPISSCADSISLEELQNANVSTTGKGFHEYPLRDQRVLLLRGVPEEGICTLCFDEWPISSRFFDNFLHPYSDELHRHSRDVYAEIFTYKTRLPWISQLTRGFLKPRQWLIDQIQDIVMGAMVSPKPRGGADGVSDDEEFKFPQNFISLHVRHGMKYLETVLFKPLKYMMVIKAKFPFIKDIFVSTETQSVITELVQDFPEYRFHYLDYSRIQYLNLSATINSPETREFDYPGEFIYSMANLYVASEAVGFVGTLSSSWCMLIQYMERTRGDGGYDYFSVDRGSAFSPCF